MANFKPNPMTALPDRLKPQPPIKLFDDLYFVGSMMVGSWVIPTSEGLVLIEGSAEADHWENCLKPGLEKLGFGDEKIIALLLTHGHMDHYAGCDHIQRATGCDICLSLKDIAYITAGVENRKPNQTLPIPQVTRVLTPGEDLVFGDHVIHVIDGAGHTPGCLNYSMEVHEGDETHRFVMMGGYGIFGPGYTMKTEYTYGSVYAVEHAFMFAGTCVKTWEYAKENNCDVFLNPHPHLCNAYELAEENKNRKPGDPNAFVCGKDGVRQWLLERFDACLEMAPKFTDINKPYTEE